MKKVHLHEKRAAHLALTAIAGAVLVGCGGGSVVSNDLPQGVTQRTVTTYSATAVGSGSPRPRAPWPHTGRAGGCR